MATGHKSPQSGLPPLQYKTKNTTTWGTGGNTVTITDAYVESNSFIIAQAFGTTPANGKWSINYGNGTFTITSADAESSTLTIEYIVL